MEWNSQIINNMDENMEKKKNKKTLGLLLLAQDLI